MLWKFTCFIFKHHVKGLGGTFIAIRRNRCLSGQNGICLSKNRFDRTIWPARAGKLFAALSFPGQRTATATLCIPHDSVCMPGSRTGKSENGFFHFDTWLQIFQNESKICEAEVTLTPFINKICKPWSLLLFIWIRVERIKLVTMSRPSWPPCTCT